MSSAELGLTHCNKCGKCCERDPCVLVAGDAQCIAAHLGVSESDFVVRYTQVERTPDGEWLVRMRRPCAFLKEGACGLHSVKPTGGAEFECWTPETWQRTYFWSRSELAAIGFSEKTWQSHV